MEYVNGDDIQQQRLAEVEFQQAQQQPHNDPFRAPRLTVSADAWQSVFIMNGLHMVEDPPSESDMAAGRGHRKWFDFGLTTDGVSGRWHVKKRRGGDVDVDEDMEDVNVDVDEDEDEDDEDEDEDEDGSGQGKKILYEHLPRNRKSDPFPVDAEYTIIDPGIYQNHLILHSHLYFQNAGKSRLINAGHSDFMYRGVKRAAPFPNGICVFFLFVCFFFVCSKIFFFFFFL